MALPFQKYTDVTGVQPCLKSTYTLHRKAESLFCRHWPDHGLHYYNSGALSTPPHSVASEPLGLFSKKSSPPRKKKKRHGISLSILSQVIFYKSEAIIKENLSY